MSLYPVNWSRLAHEIKTLNEWRCAACGKQCRRPGQPRLSWENEITVAHWDHVYQVPEVFVVALCLHCHFRHDAPYAWWLRHQRRRIFQSEAGQIELPIL